MPFLKNVSKNQNLSYHILFSKRKKLPHLNRRSNSTRSSFGLLTNLFINNPSPCRDWRFCCVAFYKNEKRIVLIGENLMSEKFPQRQNTGLQ